jgi:hypothetical protein
MVLTSYVISTALPVLMKKASSSSSLPSSSAARRHPSKHPSEKAAVVPGGSATAVLSDVLGLLLKVYFIPLVHLFGPASMGWISGLFSKKTGCGVGEDIRARAYALIQFGIKEIDGGLVEVSDERSRVDVAIRHLKERIALEAVRELERLYDDDGGGDDGERLDRERDEEGAIRGLACKDALWYLVNVFHAMLARSDDVSRGRGERTPPEDKNRRSSTVVQTEVDGSNSDDDGGLLLRDAVLTGLSRLLSRITLARKGGGGGWDGRLKKCRHRLWGDGIAEGMILAAAERYWRVLCLLD